MINLIINELIKLKKVSTYILILIIILFVFCTNVMYKYKLDENGNYNKKVIDYKEELIKQEEELNNCKSCTKEEINNIKTNIEINKIYSLYGKDSWQVYVLEEKGLKNIIKNMYDDDTYKEEYELYINKFKNDDWKYFVQEEINYYEKDSKIVELLNYRLRENISYGYDYLNDAIEAYSKNIDKNIKTYSDKLVLQDYEEDYNISKYIINTKNNVKKINDTRGIIKNFFNEYEILIVIVLIILGSSIISEEFNKGTIKQLLISPYSRIQVLISKHITLFILFMIIFLFILLLQLLFGGIFFGYNSLKIPVVIFNHSLKALEEFNVFKYLLIMFLNKLPIFILLITLLILLGLLTCNTAFTSILSIVSYLITFILISTYNSYSIPILKLCINFHWDLTYYLFGRLPVVEGMTLNKSLVICIIYFILFFTLSSGIFVNKDVKNV